MLLVVAMVLVPYAYLHLDSEISHFAKRKLEKEWPQLDIELDNAALIAGEGIRIQGLRFRDPTNKDRPLIEVAELLLRCNATLSGLLEKDFSPQQIVLRGCSLRAWKTPAGKWNLEQFLPLPKFGNRPIPIKIENSTCELYSSDKTSASSLLLHNVNLELTPAVLQNSDKDQKPRWESAVRDPKATHYLVRGSFHSEHLRKASIQGWAARNGGNWQMSGNLKHLQISKQLQAAIPAPWNTRWELSSETGAKVDVDFACSYNPTRPEPLVFDLSGNITDGEILDPRFPLHLNDLRGEFSASNAGLNLQFLSGRDGRTTLSLSCQTEGIHWPAPMQVKMDVRKLALDEDLLNSLPDSQGRLRQQWYKYLPSGEINATGEFHFDGKTWHPELKVQCVDVSFTHDKFNYRLKNGRGQIIWKNNRVTTHLQAFSGDREVLVDATVDNPGPNSLLQVRIQGNNLSVDENLLSAIPQPTQQVIRSLNPRGQFDFVYHLAKGPNTSAQGNQRLWIRLDNAEIQFDKFPYPLTNIHGEVAMENGIWKFGDPDRGPLTGRNGQASVECLGTLLASRTGPKKLHLAFQARNVPLDNDLYDSLLDSRYRQIWRDLNPQGSVQLDIDYRHDLNQSPPDIRVAATPIGKTVSIRHVSFPYRMEQVQGTVKYAQGVVTSDRLRARHGPTILATNLQVDSNGALDWRLELSDLDIGWNSNDRDFLHALPESLKRALLELNPRGHINTSGSLVLSNGSAENGLITSAWDLNLNMIQVSLDLGVKLSNIFGSIRHLRGNCDGVNYQSQGELDIESLLLVDHRILGIKGPLRANNTSVVFGAAPAEENGAPSAQHITGDLYGGKLICDGIVLLEPAPHFRLRAAVNSADLNQFATEYLTGKQQFRGKLDASVVLKGAHVGLDSLNGSGHIRLQEANIYQLPLMVSLLSLLSVRPPDTSAFTDSDIQFQIQGRHINLPVLNFYGDAISLRGEGYTNWDGDIKLSFAAIVGRNESPIPLIRNFIREASHRIMPILVEGTLEQPQARIEAFPAFNVAVQKIQENLRTGRQTTTAGGNSFTPTTSRKVTLPEKTKDY